jgi:hypothetical protein
MPARDWYFPIGLLLTACTSEPAAPTAFEATHAAVGTVRREGFGVFGGREFARASVLEGRECNMGPAGTTLDSRITYSSGGNATLRCRTNTSVGPRPAVVLRDELCAIPAPDGDVLFTFEMQFVWSPSGTATLFCHRTRR